MAQSIEYSETEYITDEESLQRELSSALCDIGSSFTKVSRPAKGKRSTPRGRSSRGSRSTHSIRAPSKVEMPNASVSTETNPFPLNSSTPEDESLNGLVKCVIEEMRKMNTKLDILSSKVDELFPRVQRLEAENIVLKDKLINSDARLAELEYRVDTVEQSKREHQLIIHSPQIDSASDNLLNETIDRISSTLRIHQSSFQGTQVHKLGVNKNTVLVSLGDTSLRAKIFSSLMKMKPRNFSVNEFLIKKREDLYRKIRDKKKENGSNFHSVFTFHGQIFMKKTRASNKELIKSYNDAESIWASQG